MGEARAALKQRRLQQAHAICGAVLAGDPAHAEALFLMGRTLQEAGDLGNALDLLNRAAWLDPTAPEPAIYLARALTEAGRAGEARTAALRALHRVEQGQGEISALALDTLGVTLDRAGEHGRAVEAARRATEAEPDRAAFWRNLGWFELHQNGVAAARIAFQRAMALDPSDHAAPAALVDIAPQTADDNLIPALERLFAAATDPDRRLLLGHALAKSFEDLKQPKVAFAWLLRAKAAKAQIVKYDPAHDRAVFAAAAAAPCSPRRSLRPEAPIFVVGLPRSGTTLLDRVITSHPDIASSGEPKTMAQALIRAVSTAPGAGRLDQAMLERTAGLDMEALGAAYLERTRPLAGGATRWLDKTPTNYLLAGLIHQALPQARIVCLRRHPLDSILSLFRQSFSPQTEYRFIYRLEDVARYYVLFDRLVAHWRSVLPADRFCEVWYEDLVSGLEGQARRVLDFCGLSWTEAALRPHENAAAVDTASAAQVRKPVHTGSVGRWRAYPDELAPAMRILEDAGIAYDETATISTTRPATVTSSPIVLPSKARATGAT